VHLTIFPDFRPNPYGLDVDIIETYINNHVSHNPAFLVETRDFTQKIERLKTERDREIFKVRQLAAAEEAEVVSQLDKVRERGATRIQEIQTLYDEKLEDARSRYLRILTSGSEASTEICMSSSRTPTLDARARTESLADTPSQTSDPNGQAALFQTTPDELDEPSIWLQRDRDFPSQESMLLAQTSDENLEKLHAEFLETILKGV
jgi:hypothetical protein